MIRVDVIASKFRLLFLFQTLHFPLLSPVFFEGLISHFSIHSEPDLAGVSCVPFWRGEPASLASTRVQYPGGLSRRYPNAMAKGLAGSCLCQRTFPALASMF